MDISEFLSIAKMVLTDKRVIGTAVVVILCMDFGAFVVNYTKKPPKPKRVRAAKSPAVVPAVEAESSAGESVSDVNEENKNENPSEK
jgi:hypothetical protein